MPKIGVKQAKDKAWKVFSKFIRSRDTCGLGTECYTCGKWGNFKTMDAGHFQPGRFGIFLFDERQVHAQCKRCNIFLKGNWPNYYKRMVKEYGQDDVNEMLEARTQIKQWKTYELEEIHKKYKAKLKS